MRRFLVIDVVGLTPKLLGSGAMPRLEGYARANAFKSLQPDLPAVTLTAQASMLTGVAPSVHGGVGNGWYFRELGEAWLWRQSPELLQAPTIFERWRTARPGQPFRAGLLVVEPAEPRGPERHAAPHLLGRRPQGRRRAIASPRRCASRLNARLGWFPCSASGGRARRSRARVGSWTPASTCSRPTVPGLTTVSSPTSTTTCSASGRRRRGARSRRRGRRRSRKTARSRARRGHRNRGGERVRHHARERVGAPQPSAAPRRPARGASRAQTVRCSTREIPAPSRSATTKPRTSTWPTPPTSQR